MVANPERRRQILDAGLDCLGELGARGLTHRAVDRRAGLPLGTTANYFPRRELLILSLVERLYQRIAPDPQRLTDVAAQHRGSAAVVAYIRYIVERLLGAPQLTLALFEVRLEAARNPAVAEVLRPFLHAGLAADQRFHTRAELPGGEREVELLHYAIDGLVFDRLTIPLNDRADPAMLTEVLTRRILQAL